MRGGKLEGGENVIEWVYFSGSVVFFAATWTYIRFFRGGR
jgi:hypothetical protein